MNRDIEIFFITILSNWKKGTILTNTCKNSILLAFLGQPYVIYYMELTTTALTITTWTIFVLTFT